MHAPDPQTPYLSILAKPTYACNMRCGACYLRHEREPSQGRMTDEVLNALISQACDLNVPRINLQWIGGESLIVGTGFYERVAQLCERHASPAITIAHYIQSNGTLVDEHWIDFFKRHPDFAVSLSFEVDRRLQEKLRPMRKRSLQSYDTLLAAFSRLREAHMSFGVLSVIVPETLKWDPAEWIREAVASGLRAVGLQLCYQDSLWGSEESVDRYLDWLERLFVAQANWNEAAEPADRLLIRESFYLYEMIRDAPHRSMSCQNSPALCTDYLITVDVDGSVYAYCDSFMGLDGGSVDFRLGNLLNDDLGALLSSPAIGRVREFMANVRSSCEGCEVHALCNGGCPIFRTRLAKGGKLVATESTSYCKLQKGILDSVRDIGKRSVIRRAYAHLGDSNAPSPFLRGDSQS